MFPLTFVGRRLRSFAGIDGHLPRLRRCDGPLPGSRRRRRDPRILALALPGQRSLERALTAVRLAWQFRVSENSGRRRCCICSIGIVGSLCRVGLRCCIRSIAQIALIPAYRSRVDPDNVGNLALCQPLLGELGDSLEASERLPGGINNPQPRPGPALSGRQRRERGSPVAGRGKIGQPRLQRDQRDLT